MTPGPPGPVAAVSPHPRQQQAASRATRRPSGVHCCCAHVSLIINEAQPSSPYVYWPVAFFLFQKRLSVPSLRSPGGFTLLFMDKSSLHIKSINRVGRHHPGLRGQQCRQRPQLVSALISVRGCSSRTCFWPRPASLPSSGPSAAGNVRTRLRPSCVLVRFSPFSQVPMEPHLVLEVT